MRASAPLLRQDRTSDSSNRARTHGAGIQLLAGLLAILSMPADPLAEAAASAICLTPPYDGSGSADERELIGLVRSVRADIEGFPSLRQTLDDAKVAICLDGSLVVTKAYYDPGRHVIVLDDDMDSGLARAVLVHELRHVEQVSRGICPSDALEMKASARATQALEADANVVSLLVAWSLRDSGDPSPWDALRTWRMTADIAARFEMSMEERGDVPEASAAAFDQWYASGERFERYYVAACSQYLDRQDADHALPSYGRLADDFLTDVCILPDGAAYACADRPDPNR